METSSGDSLEKDGDADSRRPEESESRTGESVPANGTQDECPAEVKETEADDAGEGNDPASGKQETFKPEKTKETTKPPKEDKNPDYFKCLEELTDTIEKLSVITAYPAKRPRQPHMNPSGVSPIGPQRPGDNHPAMTPRLPEPPRQHDSPRRPEPPRPPEPSRRTDHPTDTSDHPYPVQPPTPQTEQPRQTPGTARGPGTPIFVDNLFLYPMNQAFFLPTALYSTVVWAQLPSKIPASVPHSLAHLLFVDSLYVIQLSLFDYFSDLDEYYVVQNKNGECLYFVYETMDIGEFALCGSCRAYRLHFMDMFQNEVIHMSRLSGSASCCCCYPEMRVFAPPDIPAGIITKKFNFSHEEYTLRDPDRNRMFKMIGPCCANCCSLSADFSIHALDANETEVGFIRRETSSVRSYYGSDFYGLTLPTDMDVRMKAVFLGALFLTVH